MSFLEIFKAVLGVHNLAWCKSCCETQSHARGFAKDQTVHLDSVIATRSSLHRALHEIAHLILPEKGLRRYECELQANRWAEAKMRAYGISVPRKTVSAGRAYERRMKRWGDNIRRASR